MMLTEIPDPNGPKLPAIITNQTLGQTLNQVAITFGGAVLFGTCENSRVYTIDYIIVPK